MSKERLRAEKLERIANEDAAYAAWQHAWLHAREMLVSFADTQPEEVRNMLYAYTSSCEMMYQRKLDIVCRYIHFPDEA